MSNQTLGQPISKLGKRSSVNLLEEWYREAFLISSPLSISPKIDREAVDYIYNKLSTFFGKDYFIPSKPDTTIDDINWIHSLLVSKKTLGCYQILKDISTLISYYESMKNELNYYLTSVINSNKILRSFFFELYIYRQLDLCKIVNQKKVMLNGKEREGLCLLNEKVFLMECKKAYYPKLDSLDILCNLQRTLMRKSDQFRNPKGMILSINMQKPLQKRYKAEFKRLIPTLSNWNALISESTPQFESNLLDGRIAMQMFSDIALIEAERLTKYDVLFHLKPARTATGQPYLKGSTVLSFSMLQTEILKKLETILKGAKSQHRDFYGPKIFFVDTEAYPEFRMGLFQLKTSLSETEIEKIINKVGFRDTIVCILRRSITETSFVTEAYIYASEELRQEGKLIANMFKRSYVKEIGIS